VSRSERIFWWVLAVVVVGVLGTSASLSYHYGDKANTKWMSHWSQPYDLSIVKTGTSHYGSMLDTIKLVATHGGETIMRQRNMEPGLKPGYYDTVRFNKQTGQMRDTYEVEGQGYSAPLCAIAAVFFAAIVLGLIFFLVIWVGDGLSKLRPARRPCWE